MKKYVYKITNNVNGKIYIGQTNNIKRRIQEHKHDKRRNHFIFFAIKEFGWENFSVEILYYGDQFNEKEKYYIKLFKSNEEEYGYNIHIGGNDEKGENNPVSILKQKEVDLIIKDLINTDLSYDEIAKKYNVNKKYITNINKGVCWRNDDLYTYPIKRCIRRLSNESLNKIIELLKGNEFTLDEIEEITGEKRYTILNINNGNHWKVQGISYPIRNLKKYKDISGNIINLLKNSNTPIKKIANICNVGIDIVYKINNGEIYKDTNMSYPIRRLSTKRDELGKFTSGSQS